MSTTVMPPQPSPPPAPAPDVTSVEVLDDATLRIALADGRDGILDLSWLLAAPAYGRLLDRRYLRRAAIGWGTVTWPDGEDLSPESIAARLQPAGGPPAAPRHDQPYSAAMDSEGAEGSGIRSLPISTVPR